MNRLISLTEYTEDGPRVVLISPLAIVLVRSSRDGTYISLNRNDIRVKESLSDISTAIIKAMKEQQT